MLEPGSQLGPYTIAREVGRGGMGVVYLARDTRLDRDVAIKSLPEHLAADPDRLARFEREAKALAQLHHENVAGIYGVEEADGARYLILEYVEGETLADRLDRGSIPVDEAIEIATQIAAGVEAAHEAGVVHRDLKPANIKFDGESKAKVLDFGLARADESSTTGSSMSQLPTLTTPAHTPTMAGVIMGTAAYMSPEQARGRKVDKRSDIWSFGVVLYEMLTGAGPFRGETVTDSIGAILHKDVDLNALPKDAPKGVRHVISRCLERDKSLRYRDIGDVRLDLAGTDDASEEQASGARVGLGVLPAVLIVVLVAIVALTSGMQLGGSDTAFDDVMHVTVPRTVEGGFASRHLYFDVSHQHQEVIFVGEEALPDGSRVSALYVRPLYAPNAQKIKGTEHARRVHVSPDGNTLLYLWNDPDGPREEIRRVALEGGPSVTLRSNDFAGGFGTNFPYVWLSDTTVVMLNSNLLSVLEYSLESEQSRVIADVSDVIPYAAFVIPGLMMPDGRTITLSVANVKPGRGPGMDLYALDVTTGELTLIMEIASHATVFDGGRRIAFLRDDNLCVAEFDLSSKRVIGEWTPVISSVEDYEISPDGDLYYVATSGGDTTTDILSVDLQGQREVLTETSELFDGTLDLSPDGRYLGVRSRETDRNGPPVAKIIDLQAGFVTPVVESLEPTSDPIWISQNELALYQFTSFGYIDIRTVVLDSGEQPTAVVPLGESGGVQTLMNFTSDGRWMAYVLAENIDSTKQDIYIKDMESDSEARPLLSTSAAHILPTFSPNDRWLAYCTDASGQLRVVVQGFDPESGDLTGRAVPVSLRLGMNPIWSSNGEYLYFIDSETGSMKRVSVTYDPEFSLSVPEEVLTSTQLSGLRTTSYRCIELMDDDERFVFMTLPEEQTANGGISLIFNWLVELDEIMPLSN
ncbi:MAG: protein kinase domain-containing protein [Planctomycetota bacterium]|jgi:serine/threonine-protein kinase